MSDRRSVREAASESGGILLVRPVHEELRPLWPATGALIYSFAPVDRTTEPWHWLVCPTCSEKQREPLASRRFWTQTVSGPFPQFRSWGCAVCFRQFKAAVHEFRQLGDTISCSLCYCEHSDPSHTVEVP